jgi:hypothetical protein
LGHVKVANAPVPNAGVGQQGGRDDCADASHMHAIPNTSAMALKKTRKIRRSITKTSVQALAYCDISYGDVHVGESSTKILSLRSQKRL